jgi:hypothetical protein
MKRSNSGTITRRFQNTNIKVEFNVFHVRALYHTKTLITNKCTKSFIINRNTLLHVSTLLGHLQGELFVTVTPGLHFTVESECAVDCVLRCFGGVNSPRSGRGTCFDPAGSKHVGVCYD